MSTAVLTPLDLLGAHTLQRATIHSAVESQALSAFNLLPDFDGEGVVDDFLAQMFPVVTAGQAMMSTTTTNYVSQVVGSLTGTPPIATQAAITGIAALRGTAFYQVYRRPILVAAAALAAGASTAVAVKYGRDRLTRLVDDDLSLASRAATLTAISQDDRIVGYRRIIRPEMGSGRVCGLCVAASDQRYGRAELMPLHTRCRCGVMPIVQTGKGRVKDPGRTINGQDIASLYSSATDAVAGNTRGSDLIKVRFAVHEHGELGPVLRAAGDSFTGPSDLAA